MIMKYYKDIEWTGFNRSPVCRAWVDKYFNDYYVLDYADSGELTVQTDENPELQLKGPAVWWTFPGPRIRFGVKGRKSWDHRWIGFKGPKIKEYIDGGLIEINPVSPVVKIVNSIRFKRAFDELIDYLESPLYGNERAVHLFEGLLLQLHEQSIRLNAESPTEKKVRNLIQIITASPEGVWDFPFRSRQLGISYSHFRRIFHSMTGLAPTQFVNRTRLEKAAKMLRENNLEIKEISRRSGIDDIYYFSKLFKKQFGIPPGAYRARASLK
jgi:AraC-like DNA-binding protein